MSGAASFSYAQAAKGRAAPITTPSGSAASPAEAVTTDPSVTDPSGTKDEAEARVQDDTSVEPAEIAPPKHVDWAEEVQETVDRIQSTQEPELPQPTETTSTSQPESLPSREPRYEATPEWRKQSSSNQAPRLNGRSAEGPDSRKARKGKKPRSPEKEPLPEVAQIEKKPEPVKPQLVEAPPPAVNVWDQRKKAATATKDVITNKKTTASKANVDSAIAAPKSVPAGAQKTAKDTVSPQPAAPVSQKEASATNVAESNTAENDESKRPPRGSRVPTAASEKTAPETSLSSQDATAAWPKPEPTATEEVKHTATNTSESEAPKEQSEENGPAKAHGKTEWKSIPFTPSVVFETAMPQRGGGVGRGRGGPQAGRVPNARTSRTSNTNVATDKSAPTAEAQEPNSTATEGQEKPQPEALPSKPDPRVVEDSRRIAADGPVKSRKQAGPHVNTRPGPGGSTDFVPSSSDTSKPPRKAPFNGPNGQGPPRGTSEARGSRDSDSMPPPFKDLKRRPNNRGGLQQGSHGSHGYTQQPYYSAQAPAPHGRFSGGYSPSPYQTGYPTAFPGPQAGRSRQTQSSNGSYYGEGQNRDFSAASRVPMQNGAAPEFEQGDYAALNDPAYAANLAYSTIAWTGIDLGTFRVLQQQAEYYFSEENLPKDEFLRSMMDEQGFVPMATITGFNRISKLSTNLLVLRAAFESMEMVEYVIGDDNIERLRPRRDYQRWVMPKENRREEARNDGPARFQVLSTHSKQVDYRFTQPMTPSVHTPVSPGFFPPYQGDMPYGYSPFANGYAFSPMQQPPAATNGYHLNGQSFHENQQLNAAVPAFSPSGMFNNIGLGLQNAGPTAKQEAPSPAKSQLNGASSEHHHPLVNGHAGHNGDAPKTNGVAQTNGHVHDHGSEQSSTAAVVVE